MSSIIKPVVVVGNVNVDITLRAGEPYHDSELFGPDRAMQIVGSSIHIGKDAYLSVPYEGKRLIFLLPPGEFPIGAKITAIECNLVGESEDIRFHHPESPDGPKLSRGEWAWPLPGGGGANVGRGLYRLFPRLPRMYVATCSADQERGFRTSLGGVWGGASQLAFNPVKAPPGVNVILEGLGTFLDRTIFRAPQERHLPISWNDRDGTGIYMVNTIYNAEVAFRSLIQAMRADGFVIACTESLCDNKYTLPDSLVRSLLELVHQAVGQDKHVQVDSMRTIHGFLQNVVLRLAQPKSHPSVWVFNETEFAHFLRTSIMAIIGGQAKFIMAHQLLRGFHVYRNLERRENDKQRSVVFVTCGPHGAFALDSQNGVHFCSVLTLNAPVQEKNAIGDLFAATLLGVIAGGIHSRSHGLPGPDCPSQLGKITEDQLWIAHALLAASAAADSGVYDGFRAVSQEKVNSRLSLKAPNYYYLGKLDALIPRLGSLDMDLKDFVDTEFSKLGYGQFKGANIPQLKDIVDPAILDQ